MRMHERLGDTTHDEANKDIPNEMKHIFVVTSAISKFNRSNSKIVDRK
jgi:hypothetical protein